MRTIFQRYIELGNVADLIDALILIIGGLAAAFGVTACCALPLLLIIFGLGTASLGGIASIVEPICTLLLAVVALALAGGAILLWRQQRQAAARGPGGICTPPAVRRLTLFGLIVGAVLLCAGYLYS